jgi:AcrR family transcriptional regulator
MDDQLDQLRMQPTTVPETLLSMVPVVLRVLEEGHAQFPLYLEFWNRATRDPAVWEASIEPYHRYRNFFAKMIQAGIEEGTLEEIDPRSGAALVVALGVGLIIQGLLDPEGAQWEQIADESVSILLNGLMR